MTEEELDDLAARGTDEEKRAVAKHPNASLQTLLSLAREGIAEDVDQNPMLLLYVEAGSSEAIKILERVAEQTNRKERLGELATSLWMDVRRGVARNTNSAPSILMFLSEDENWTVRHDVARNMNTPPDILVLLAKDTIKDVRRCVADNANTPVDTLVFLAEDDDNVRCGVASNASTPPAILAILAEDKMWTVRRNVAMNRNTPPSALTFLSMAEDLGVRSQAKTTLAKLERLIP